MALSKYSPVVASATPVRVHCLCVTVCVVVGGPRLVFSNGPAPLNGFRMIERHYFRDHLIKSFDFDFGFVIPSTTNTWESVYTMPPMSEELSAS